MANDYKVGQVWEDSEGDPWKVVVDDLGELAFDDASGFWAAIVPVEEDFGPLKLVEEFHRRPAVAPSWDGGYIEFATKDPGEPPFTNNRLYEIVVDGSLADRVSHLNGGESYLEDVVATYESAFKLLFRKSADYGPRNIADSPGGPLNGLRVRMWDKMARIKNLTDSGAEPENESLRDSFLDLGNYCMIALMVIDGNWPGTDGR